MNKALVFILREALSHLGYETTRGVRPASQPTNTPSRSGNADYDDLMGMLDG